MIHASHEPSNPGPTVQVILGSVRAGRHCLKIGAWVAGIAREATGLRHELVDLADWPLPMDDEPGIPQAGVYVHAHTLAWSRKVASADAIVEERREHLVHGRKQRLQLLERGDGYLIVTAEYNHGYPAVLKNALDHLYKEWSGKPLVIVTYGGHGGIKCAAQLRQVAEGIGMHPAPTMPALTLTRAMIMGGPVDPEQDFQDHAGAVRQVDFPVQRIIHEETGRMIHLKNTVGLKGVTCQGRCARNCARANTLYWRESWLERVDPEVAS